MRPRARPLHAETRRLLLIAGAALLLGTTRCASILGFDDTTLRTGDAGLDGPIAPDEGGTNDGGTNDGGGDGSTSRLTTTPTSLLVHRSGSTDLTVDVVRGSDVTGTVTLTLSGLPTGVTSTTVNLVPPAVEGKLTISATAKATLGEQTISLNAGGTALPASTLPLLVAGPAGSLDTTFNTTGIAVDASKGLGSTFFALSVQTDTKIVAGGVGGPAGGPLAGWIVKRFIATGAPDTPFDNNTTNDLPADGQLQGLAIDATGRIVGVGTSLVAGVAQLTVVRLLPSGAVDTSFNSTGLARLPALETAPGGSTGYGVAIQPDNAVVVVGSRIETAGTETGLVARFTAAGAHDPTFNAGATLAVPNTRFVGVSIDTTGGIVAGGSNVGLASPSYVLVKRTSTGAADATFGTGGTSAFAANYLADAFTHLPGGAFALVGAQLGTDAYTAGVADPKGAQMFARAFATPTGAAFHGIAAEDATRFVAAGHTGMVNGEARVMRIATTGVPDPTFGDAGTVLIEQAGVVGNMIDTTLFSAAVQVDGRILVAGNRTTTGAAIFRLWQ